MRVSICDDDQIVLSELERIISSFFQGDDIVCQVETFSDPLTFLASAKSDLPDIAFIGLMLGHIDGFDVARELRNQSLETEIIFVTSYLSRMPEAFVYKPIAFLKKPIVGEDVEAVLKTIMAYYWHKGLAYIARVKGERRRIPHKTIEYFESRQHRIILHFVNDDAPISFVGKLDDVEGELKGLPYVRCHKSYIVQVSAVKTLDKTGPSLVTHAGRRVPISRKYYRQVIQEFIDPKLQ